MISAAPAVCSSSGVNVFNPNNMLTFTKYLAIFVGPFRWLMFKRGLYRWIIRCVAVVLGSLRCPLLQCCRFVSELVPVLQWPTSAGVCCRRICSACIWCKGFLQLRASNCPASVQVKSGNIKWFCFFPPLYIAFSKQMYIKHGCYFFII